MTQAKIQSSSGIPLIAFGVGEAGCRIINEVVGTNSHDFASVFVDTDNKQLCQNTVSTATALIRAFYANTCTINEDAIVDEVNKRLDMIARAPSTISIALIVCAIGGNTGSQLTAIIARLLRARGILTLCIMTIPFLINRQTCNLSADEGITDLRRYADTIITIPYVIDTANSFAGADRLDNFMSAQTVLSEAILTVANLVHLHSICRSQFDALCKVLTNTARASAGYGESFGIGRANKAVEMAVARTHLQNLAIANANGILLHIMGGYDMKLADVDDICSYMNIIIKPDATLVVGSTFDPSIAGMIRVSLIITVE